MRQLQILGLKGQHVAEGVEDADGISFFNIFFIQ